MNYWKYGKQTSFNSQSPIETWRAADSKHRAAGLSQGKLFSTAAPKWSPLGLCRWTDYVLQCRCVGVINGVIPFAHGNKGKEDEQLCRSKHDFLAQKNAVQRECVERKYVQGLIKRVLLLYK